MNKSTYLFILALLAATITSQCNQVPSTKTVQFPTATQISPSPTPRSVLVTSAFDSGSGSLRQALQDALPEDIITFDPLIFPPDAPVTISVLSALPTLSRGNLTIDASNAGVILDGSKVDQPAIVGLWINSNENTIRGLQIVNFSGNGVLLIEAAQKNTIGGNRETGSGPLGQGNLFSSNSERGIAVIGEGTSFNTIIGNFIGTDVSGRHPQGNGMGGITINGASFNQVSDNLVSSNNGYGIELCCTSNTRENTISGNRVGTDASGLTALGNVASGIALHNGATKNTIGPDNLIAYNSSGIDVYTTDSLYNTIVQNSIYENMGEGIFLSKGGNSELHPPLILNFNLEAGTMLGSTCANCNVMIYSDSGSQGKFYEGQATGDGKGTYIFEKGAAFAGPQMTATATDIDGNTSEFSVPTWGASRILIMQEDNNSLRTIYESKPSIELSDNHIGLLYGRLYLLENPQGNLNSEIVDLGIKYVKLTITEPETLSIMGASGIEQSIRWDISEFSFAPESEDFITGLAENDITVDYLLNFWDKANHPQGWQPVNSRFRTQEEIDHYLEYVRFIVGHFKDRITHYEIWNEPDNNDPLQRIQPIDYVNLVKQTVPVIRAEDPNAKIVMGGSTGLRSPDGQAYLFNLLDPSIMTLVDMITWHPFYGDSPVYNNDYYNEYPALVEQIKALAVSHGFNGEYRSDEVLYMSRDCASCDPSGSGMLYTDVAASKYYARGIITNLGLDVGVGVAGMGSSRRSFTVIQNLCTLMAGANAVEIPIMIQSEATNVVSYSFSLDDGDYLIALWTNGVAADEDPGIVSTISIPNVESWTATGIDILHGYKQELKTINGNGDLIIQNLLIKDYPIIIQLES